MKVNSYSKLKPTGCCFTMIYVLLAIPSILKVDEMISTKTEKLYTRRSRKRLEIDK
ncbi:hypothetical protein GFO_1848 [Christiangramia forsetii KT0803]|uniref:Uncharacterized protein n=1 Tax=Christiangramia forsetii (strain DSM 17595 / CGMCC 1.15422 / KT0803) TaxID=411154 RepID=A0M2H3_CHRFK|nr:hypothetical protein GFO_1848 [Christiangramia forsetii KT0803]